MTENIDLNQLTNLTSQQKAGTQSLLANQSASDADYLRRYTAFINGQEGSQALATRLGQELGLPALQSNATMLRNTLTNLPSVYSKASQGYEINNNQLQRIIGQKASELSPAVTTAENSLANANTNLNTQMSYATADQARLEKPYTVEQQTLADRQAREVSLYSQSETNELNALINKLSLGQQWSIAEADRAQQLSLKEKDYENAKANAQPNTQVISQGGKSYLIDSGTGKIISTYGSGSGDSTDYYSGLGASGAPTYSARAGTLSADSKWYSTGNGWIQTGQ
jgi:hypothetical protein